MAGMISVRFSRAERVQIRERQREAGFPTLSAYVRVKLGFDASGGIDPAEASWDEIDSARLVQAVLELRSRFDDQSHVLKQLARAQGIRLTHLDEPREYAQHKPVDPPGEDGYMDVPDQRQLNSKLMPTGFERT